MDPTPSSPLGEYIRRQRELQKLSMRQLATLVGISNPYLSQIERGLRDPSEKVLDAIARNLELSAETLHAQSARAKQAEQAGDDDGAAVIHRDPRRSPIDGRAAPSAAGGLRRIHRRCRARAGCGALRVRRPRAATTAAR